MKFALRVLREQYPGVQFRTENENEITIFPKDNNGFEIFIQQGDRENTIHFGTWHFHFDNNKEGMNELLDYLGFGMSKLGRLKAYSKNGKEYKWTFEIKNVYKSNRITQCSTRTLTSDGNMVVLNSSCVCAS